MLHLAVSSLVPGALVLLLAMVAVEHANFVGMPVLALKAIRLIIEVE